MLEILTKSGAVIHVDPLSAAQMQMLEVATTAFGGVLIEHEITTDEATA